MLISRLPKLISDAQTVSSGADHQRDADDQVGADVLAHFFDRVLVGVAPAWAGWVIVFGS